jgi:tetratricopeptide (TPR) repeat protein
MHTVLFALALTLQGPPAIVPSESSGTVGEAYYLFLEGQALEERSDLEGAADLYRRALALVPDAAGVRAELATVYAQQGDLARARSEAERAVATAPDHRAAHRLLGLIAAAAVDDPDAADKAALARRAIDHLERARGRGIADPTVLLTLGEMYVQAGQHTRAIEILQNFLLDRPGYPQAVMLLVEAYRSSGQHEAADQLVRSLRGNAANAMAVRLRGIEGLERRGEWAEAAAAWRQLIDEQPNTSFRLRFATALVNAGELAAGRAELDAITAEVPGDVRAWYLLVQVQLQSGLNSEAEAAARRIAEIDPEDGRGPLALAMVLGERDAHRDVITLLEPRVARPVAADVEGGTFGEMVQLLARAYREAGDVDRAVQTFERGLTQTPDDARLLFGLAATYENDEQFDRAEAVFRQLIALDPSHAPALNYLGYMLADRGEKLEEAIDLIERAIDAGGENPAYLDSLGWAYYRLERFDEAVTPLERAAAGAPTVSVILEHLGDTYMRLGRYEQAAEAFGKALSGDRDGVDMRALEEKRERARRAAGTAAR